MFRVSRTKILNCAMWTKCAVEISSGVTVHVASVASVATQAAQTHVTRKGFKVIYIP